MAAAGLASPIPSAATKTMSARRAEKTDMTQPPDNSVKVRLTKHRRKSIDTGTALRQRIARLT
ncbi:hypothetical protein GCM10028792_11250 [Salinisphaera aquimarina]